MERLLRSELFTGMASPVARSLAQVGRIHLLREGSYLMREGDQPTFLAVLLRGRLAVLSAQEEVAIAEIHSGSPVGELGLVTGRPRGATVVAFEEAELWRLERADYERLRDDGDPRAAALLRQLGRVLGERLRTQHLDGLAMVPGLAQDPRGQALLTELGWRWTEPTEMG